MFGVSALRRRRYVLVGAALVTYILYLEFPRGLIGLLPSQLQPQQFVETSPLQLPHLLPRDGTIQRTNLRVAVLEHAGFHDEVVGPVLKTLDDIGADYTIYRNDWRWGFEKVLGDYLNPMPLLKRRTELAEDAKTDQFDLVIHVSCDHGWRNIGGDDGIFETLDNKKDLHYICIQHELEMLRDWHWENLTPAVKQGRFRFMTLSPHTTRALNEETQKAALRLKDVAWASVKVDTLVPVFPLSPAPDPEVTVMLPGANGRLPARIAILGRVMLDRRNYQPIIDDFHQALLADPAAWGYLPPTSDTAPYESAEDPDRPPVSFHFIGSVNRWSTLKIPASMEHLITVHWNTEYDRFYQIISTMDLILPAFKDFVYLKEKLSSAIPASVIARVPILATPLLLEAYAFLRSPAIILHPSGTSEIEAISLIRKGIDPMTLAPKSRTLLPDYSGWDAKRNVADTRNAWRSYHDRIYSANAAMMNEVLGDIQQQRLERGWSVGRATIT